MAEHQMVIMIFVSVYLLTSLIIHELGERYVLYTIGIWCSIEILIGILELIGIIHPKHILFEITGSFYNPGPYAGFISIISCVLLSDTIIKTHKNNLFFTIVGIAGLIMILFLNSRAALLAFFVSSFIVIKKAGLWSKVSKGIKCCLFILLLIISSLLYAEKKTSADGRLLIDKICLNILKKRLLENGDRKSFAGAYGQEQASYFRKLIETKDDEFAWRNVPSRERIAADSPEIAFNEFIQIGVDCGLMSLFLFVVMLFFCICISYKKNQCWCFGLVAYCLFSFFSYPFHVRQLQILFPILIAGCVIPEKKMSFIHFSLRLSCLFISILGGIITGKNVDVDQHDMDIVQKIESWFKFEQYDIVVDYCDKHANILQDNNHIMLYYGQSLSKMGQFERSDYFLSLGVNKSNDPMFWNAKGQNYLDQGCYREAEECYKNAFYMVPNRLYPLTLLAKMYYIESDTVRFLKMADLIESFEPKVESEYTEQLRSEIKDLKYTILP